MIVAAPEHDDAAVNVEYLNQRLDQVTEYVDDKVKTFTVTLGTSWSGIGPYSQTATVSGLLATDNPMIDAVLSATAATAKAQRDAWALVDRITTAANSITAYAYDKKPTTAIPIQIKVMR